MKIIHIKEYFIIALFLLFCGITSTTQAQNKGNTARGGSLSREIIKDSTERISIPELVKYRLAIKKLNINEDVLTSQFNDLREKKANIKLKDLILAYLIIQKEAVEKVYIVDEFIAAYQIDQDFYQAFRDFLSMNVITIKNRKQQAEITLKDAMKK